MTIRERIISYQNEILNGELQPVRASEILTELSALIGNINDRITETDILYNKVLLSYYDIEKTANRAIIKANITEEYKNLKDAKTAEKVATQMIQSLKYLLKVKADEWKSAGNQ